MRLDLTRLTVRSLNDKSSQVQEKLYRFAAIVLS